MGLLLRFAKLGAHERRLLLGAGVLILATRLGLRVLPYRTLLRALDRYSRWAPTRTGYSPEQVRWALSAAARRLPGTGCLAWALACRSLLRQAGFSSELRIGVTKTPEGRFLAHAWVECGGTSLSFGDDERAYAPLAPLLGEGP